MIAVFLKGGTRVELAKAADAKSVGNTVDNTYIQFVAEDGKTIIATFRYSELSGWVIGEDYGVQSP